MDQHLKWVPEWYLSYDIKGIQQFIYTVPKLKYVVGASLLIDEFDSDAKDLQKANEYEPIFTGGGKGTFQCASEGAAKTLREELVAKARENGLDLRIGIAKELSEATKHADDLYPYVPDSLEGEPCAVSGLWPVKPEDAKKRDGINGIHPLIAKRADTARDGRSRKLDTRILDAIRPNLPESLLAFEKVFQKPLEFLTVIGADTKMDSEEYATARAADRALGARNRWAILSMDGNDMGAQFRAFEKTNPSTEEKTGWMSVMSGALRDTTQQAFLTGLTQAIQSWWQVAEQNESLLAYYKEAEKVVLPFRPLILGGDDILCICHCSYAMEMAKTIIETFSQKSEEAEEDAKKQGIERLWLGTGGRLTISAGIAYTGVTLPLFLSIPYAEHLLASAKKRFRHQEEKPEPTPAAIDWESITETMVDTPEKRRERDLTFIDGDLGKKITLTMRPYRIESPQQRKSKPVLLQDIQDLKKELATYPRSLLMELMTILRLPYNERVTRLTAIAARETSRIDFIQRLDEGILLAQEGTCWQTEGDEKKNYFLDAILLLEEEKRMEKETIE